MLFKIIFLSHWATLKEYAPCWEHILSINSSLFRDVDSVTLKHTLPFKSLFLTIRIPKYCQSGRAVKAYEYYQTCIATKTFEFFCFLSEARKDTPNLTACCTNAPNLILLKIGHLCLSFVQVFP